MRSSSWPFPAISPVYTCFTNLSSSICSTFSFHPLCFLFTFYITSSCLPHIYLPYSVNPCRSFYSSQVYKLFLLPCLLSYLFINVHISQPYSLLVYITIALYTLVFVAFFNSLLSSISPFSLLLSLWLLLPTFVQFTLHICMYIPLHSV